ncbi:MAG: nucleotidyltransferase [Chloroflexi bacterium]|nr:nucleotidyltransferase [Chloroflexota bacterium]
MGKIEGGRMKLHDSLEPFKETIEAIQRVLAKFDNRGVIIGGIAASFLGKPRFTEDVDAVFILSIEDIPSLIEIAKAEKIVPRIEKADEFARKNRVLLLVHSPTETKIDISLGALPFEEEMVKRGTIQSSATLSVRLPTPEDLIIMKAIAHRPKDMEDIRAVVDKQSRLDRKRIKYWVSSFAEVLEMPDLWKQIEEILKG